MRSMVYVTVRCLRLSVCPVYLLLQQRAAGLLLSATRAVRYRSTAAGAQQQRRRHNTAHSNTAVNSKCEQCHVYSRRSRLNTRLEAETVLASHGQKLMTKAKKCGLDITVIATVYVTDF